MNYWAMCCGVLNVVFLQFMYTDHAQIDDDIVMELLSFSDKMRETRLISWCEYLMSKVIERAVEQSIEKADLDIIGLLLTAQRHNGMWHCVHWVDVYSLTLHQLYGDNVRTLICIGNGVWMLYGDSETARGVYVSFHLYKLCADEQEEGVSTAKGRQFETH